jgi:hypothetical protein
MRSVAVVFLLSGLLCAQQTTTFEERPAIVLSNGTLELTVFPLGATLANLVLVDDPSKLSPLWNPARHARELKAPPRFGNSFGHFVCVDGFGGVSAEEKAAGLSSHGEAFSAPFETASYKKDGNTTTLAMTAQLPLVQEKVTRTVQMVDGESVVYVRTHLESLTAFDRPISWAEHATIGAPFLEAGATAMDLPATRSKTRPYSSSGGQLPHRLASDKEFTWPMAPLVNGELVDLRTAPAKPNSGDHTTTLLDSSLKHVWVTALNPGKKLIVGWVFKAADFPWLQNWEFYPANGALARGLEFSTQPFDVPRRDAVALNGLFGAPTFRWLPAKSAIETTFAVFYGRVPDGFNKVAGLHVEDGKIVAADPAGRTVSFAASLPF